MKKVRFDSKSYFQAHIDEGIIKVKSKPKWGKNYSAIIIVDYRTTKHDFIPVEVEVLNYFPQAIR